MFVATLPLGIKLVEGGLSWKATRVDVPVIIFGVTAIIGYTASYDRTMRWSFLWLVMFAILFFYITSRRTIAELWIMLDGWMLAAAAVSVYFLFTHDWLAYPAEFGWLQKAGMAWENIRPDLGLEAFEPNIVGGVLAVLAPMIVAAFVRGLLAGQRKRTLIRLLVLSLTLVGILLSSSRGAWMALLIGSIVAAVWVSYSNFLPIVRMDVFRKVSALMLIPGLVLGFWILSLTIGNLPVQLDAVIPGAPGAQSRAALTQDAIRLLQDYPFTGSGLASFPGQYSRYVLVVSQYYFGYAHNLFLDIALAQGPFGLTAMVVMLAGALWLLIALPPATDGLRRDIEAMRTAIIASLIVVVMHGLVDDPLYTSRGIVVLFFLPACAVAIHRQGMQVLADPQESGSGTHGYHWWTSILTAASGIAIVIALAGTASPNGLLSKYLSNQAAISLSRRELAGFPGGVVFQIEHLAADGIQRQRLERAIELDRENRTAFHRLGLLELRRGDFQPAALRLEQALSIDPNHQGISKALGYTYVWLGEFEKAETILAGFPAARTEMEGYAHWWSTQDRPDLSENASRMTSVLKR